MEDFSSLDLIPIEKLLNGKFDFWVPAYQRGYRWSSDQAVQLIDDILEFRKYYYSKDDTKYYCLQPLVVTGYEDENKQEYLEVIDGQQRLTTVLLILQALHLILLESVLKSNVVNMITTFDDAYRIKYETRNNSDEWLRDVNKVVYDEKAYKDFDNSNCDYSHIAEVFKAVYERLRGLTQDERNDFAKVLRQGTRFIWYYPQKTSGTNADIFDRLNAGKIGLNNAELIKAVLLQKSNWGSNVVASKSLALEWNEIENKLQDKELWGFIYSSQHPYKYDTHIEYLFDLLKGKNNSHKDKHFYTFNQYLDSYRVMMERGSNDVAVRTEWVKKQWLEVKELFDTLCEWYNNKSLYHRIGFLLEYKAGESVLTLKEILNGKKHKERINQLDDMIRDTVNVIKSDHLVYGKSQMSEILFLYNVMLEEARVADNARFSFADYKDVRKTTGWDQEHVASHTDNIMKTDNLSELALDVIELLVDERPPKGEDGIFKLDNLLFECNTEDEIPKKELELVSDSLSILNLSQDDNNEDEINVKVEKYVNSVTSYFKADDRNEFKINTINGKEKDEKDFIWNFVLLNAHTNRSYGNSLYPVKRRRILRDEFNVYTPVGTRNVFEKAYSKNIKDMMYWTKSDAISYWNSICRVLNPYISLTLPFDR